MYVSNYFNIIKLSKDEYILNHSFKGSIDILEKKYTEKLLEYRKNGKKIEEKYFDKKILNRLIEKGYLVSNKAIDKENFLNISNKLYYANFKRNKVKSYTLIPSYDCNFRCSYCFELDTLNKNKDFIISEKLIDILFNKIENEIKCGYTVNLTLFGGEPLLPKNKKIINYILSKASNISLKLNIISNGYFLYEFSELLNSNNTNDIQITLDGDRAIHDSRRVLYGGKGTFDNIFNNILSILKNKNSPNITVRINVDKENLESIPNLISIFRNNNLLENKKFNFYTKSVHACYMSPKDKFYDSDIVNNISLSNDNIKNMETNITYRRILNDIKVILNKNSLGFLRTTHCGSVNGMLVIDPLGKLYSCYEEINNPLYCVGNIDIATKEFILFPKYNYWLGRHIQNIKICDDCSYALVCGGGCPKHAKVCNNSIYSTDCTDFKKIYNEVFKEVFLLNES